MKCPNCEYDNDIAATFCAKCGTALNVMPPNGAEYDNTPEPSRDETVANWRKRYERDRNEGRQSVSGSLSGDFRRSLLKTAIPLVVLSLISLMSSFAEGLGFVWLAGAIGFLIAFIIGIIVLVSGERVKAAGIFTGIAIGAVSLGLTCIANLGNMF